MTEKFLKSTDLQTEEVRTVIGDCISFIKEKLAPALDMLTPTTIEKLTNQFLLEQKAIFALDEKAVDDGFENEADRQHKIAKEKKDKEATLKAEQEAKEKAQRDEEERIIREKVESDKALQIERDKEDAEREAVLKAKLAAEKRGETLAEFN